MTPTTSTNSAVSDASTPTWADTSANPSANPSENSSPQAPGEKSPPSVPSLESHSARHPQADDPSSRHFVRPKHHSGPRKSYGQCARQHATLPLVFLAALHAQTSTLPPAPDFAYECCMSPDDPAFSEFQRSDNDALIKAFLCQYNGLGIALALSATQTSDMGVLHIPAGYQQACTSPQRSHWMAAIQKELGGLVTLHTWDLVPRSELPKGSNVMRCHFILL